MPELPVALEPVTACIAVIIPTFNEAESIGQVVAELPTELVGDVVAADGGGTDGTQELASVAGARGIEVGPGTGACWLEYP